ncbi:MAG: DUF2568 domain-containing protein [Brevundimonas sp.]
MTPEDGAPPVVGGRDVVAFLAEIVLLAAAAFAGWVVGWSTVSSWLLAVLLPLAVATVWGVWLAPRSSRRLGPTGRWRVQLALVVAVGLVGVTPDGMWWFPSVLLLPLGVFAADFASGRA